MKQTPDLLLPASVQALTDEVKRCETALLVAKKALNEANRGAMIRCCCCAKAEPISTQVYIQTHWYTSPHGCTGGDYWNQGEAQWQCPNCWFVNRFDAESGRGYLDFYRPEIVALQHLFAKTEDTHRR